MADKAQDPEVTITGEGEILSLLTWNIDGLDAKDTFERTRSVIDDIRRLKPDVVFLQEIIPMTWHVLENALASDYDCRSANSELPYFHGIFILKKKSIVVDDTMKITKFPNSSMLRHLLHQKVFISGSPLHLFTSHLESMKSHAQERKSQLAQCFQQMTAFEPSLLAGDLNVRDAEVLFVGRPESCVDAWESCGSDPNHQYTWDTAENSNLGAPYKSRLRFDRVFLNQTAPAKVTPLSFRLIGKEKIQSCGRFPSDHWGILVEFEMHKRK